jgi:hypothetical protein
MRLSRSLAVRWRDERLDEALEGIVLQQRLRTLVEAPFVRKAGGLLLEPLTARAAEPNAFADRTGYEAFINKVHIDDCLDDEGATLEGRLSVLTRQGVKAAIELAKRLEREGRYRVVLSLDAESPTVTLRFFGRRRGESWGDDDPDAYALEEVLMIDTGV